jgi:LuxR family maltose regulon positive regulatory protein
MSGIGQRDAAADRGIGQRALATKLRPPLNGVRHMPRPRLASALAGAGLYRLALVSAPAGSGKTTMLSEWHLALRERRAAAWLSLDDFDNDPRRFLIHLIFAIRASRPDFGREAMDVLSANPDVPVEEVASSLVHDFGGEGPQIVIFLDDYHEIRSRAIHGAMGFLLRFAPAHVRFVISTRRNPPLSVERLRARGEVLEVRWEDLRFNVGEARDYLKGVCRLRLSEEQVHTLCRRTEGWITGLQLAAMTMGEAKGPDDGIVARFSGTHRAVAGYLLEDVFSRQSPPVRQFLARTSILDRMTAPLCDALTGRQDSRQLIETLERSNLFVFCLDEQRTWYRYHHLFAEFLRQRLKADHSGEVAGLHDRASEWFERNGLLADAVRYAMAGSRFRRAARLLETEGRELFRQGDFKELRRWMDALPDRTVRRSPVLCALHAWALAYMGEFDGARRRVACAEEAVAKPVRSSRNDPSLGTITVEAELQVLRAVIGVIQTDEPDVSGLHPAIMSQFPPGESALRAYASIMLGHASRAWGNLSRALGHFREALEISDGADSALVNLNARLNVGMSLYLMGRTDDAEGSFRESLEHSRERHWQRSIGAAFLRYGLALVLHEKNRLGEALEELSEAVELLEFRDAFGFLGMALVERARIRLATGASGQAEADLAQARRVARRHDVKRVSFRADLLEARMAVQAGELSRAEALLSSAAEIFEGKDVKGRAPFPEKYEYYLAERLRLLLARGRFGEAVRLAARALQSARAAGRGRNAVEFLVLQAAAWHGLSENARALAKLGQALSLASEKGQVRPFAIDGPGKGVVNLLRQLGEDERHREAARRVLAALAEEEGEPAGKGSAAGPAGDPLHHREVQILRLVSQGLRNREIGRRLFLSEETVKWYLKRLYGKLCVGTRTEAIASARKMGLLG